VLGPVQASPRTPARGCPGSREPRAPTSAADSLTLEACGWVRRLSYLLAIDGPEGYRCRLV